MPFARWLEENMPFVVATVDELQSQEENWPFHTENIKNHVDVNFQQLNGKFRILNLVPTKRVSK